MKYTSQVMAAGLILVNDLVVRNCFPLTMDISIKESFSMIFYMRWDSGMRRAVQTEILMST